MTQTQSKCEVDAADTKIMANVPESISDVESLLRTECPKHPVYCIYPHVYREIAAEFLAGFPGRVLYAVKANPEPTILKLLIDSGVRHFDCASLPELERLVADKDKNLIDQFGYDFSEGNSFLKTKFINH